MKCQHCGRQIIDGGGVQVEWQHVYPNDPEFPHYCMGKDANGDEYESEATP